MVILTKLELKSGFKNKYIFVCVYIYSHNHHGEGALQTTLALRKGVRPRNASAFTSTDWFKRLFVFH